MNRLQITWGEVYDRIGANRSGLWERGHSVTERPTDSALIEFLEGKTAPRGRWTAEKAAASIVLLKQIKEAPSAQWKPERAAEAAAFMKQVNCSRAHVLINGHAENPKHETTQPAPAARRIQHDVWRFYLLLGVVLIPTGASVQNMYHVAYQIGENAFAAVLFTALLSVTALAFTVAGVRSWFTVVLAVLLVAYEAFCNMTRIYSRLMPYSERFAGRMPSEFTGQVTDVFGTGSHETAVALAAITALIIAVVQYAGIYEINTRRNV